MEEEIQNEDEIEESEVDILEFSLDDEEIDELISKLQELKQTKTQMEYGIDDENELLIHYENEREEDSEKKNEGETQIDLE